VPPRAAWRQAVLLFRGTPFNTSNFEAPSSDSSDSGAGQIGPAAIHETPPSQS